MPFSIQHASCVAVLLFVGLTLSACSTAEKPSRKYSIQDCKQMHGRGNISLKEWRECRFTGQVLRLKKQ